MNLAFGSTTLRRQMTIGEFMLPAHTATEIHQHRSSPSTPPAPRTPRRTSDHLTRLAQRGQAASPHVTIGEFML